MEGAGARCLRCEVDDDRDVVRGLGLGAFLAVGLGGGQAFGEGRGEEGVVDAEAGVAAPGAGLVVPEGVGAAGGLEGSDGVGEAVPEEGSEGGAGFGADEGVGGREGAGGVVLVGGGDVVVAGEDAGGVVVEEGFGAGGEEGHPAEFVGVAFVAARVAVREVEVADCDAVGFDFDVAGLGVVVGQAGEGAVGYGDGDAGENGDAVVAFLADDVCGVAGEGVGWELGLLALDFLQEQEVGLSAGEPGGDVGFALADGVDVPGGDAHGLQSTEKLVPHPQAEVALGFLMVKWAPMRASV